MLEYVPNWQAAVLGWIHQMDLEHENLLLDVIVHRNGRIWHLLSMVGIVDIHHGDCRWLITITVRNERGWLMNLSQPPGYELCYFVMVFAV